MNPWSHLPNAHHIDWVLQSVKDNPELWAAAWVASRTVAEGTTWPKLEESRYSVKLNSGYSVWDAVWYAGTGSVARCSLAALVAYDDCDQYLSMTYDELKTWALLSEAPQAILLLTMKWVQENECMVTTA